MPRRASALDACCNLLLKLLLHVSSTGRRAVHRDASGDRDALPDRAHAQDGERRKARLALGGGPRLACLSAECSRSPVQIEAPACVPCIRHRKVLKLGNIPVPHTDWQAPSRQT
eukprot:363275-Chlamydomonas_euryale.AAC.12